MAIKLVRVRSFYFCDTLPQAIEEMERRGWKRLPTLPRRSPPEALVGFVKSPKRALVCWEAGTFIVLEYGKKARNGSGQRSPQKT